MNQQQKRGKKMPISNYSPPPVDVSTKKRAALYIRVSTDEQARHGFSLGEQRLDLEAYAAAHGYEVADVYADEGVSARKRISRRHELQRLLRDVQDGRIDIIVMKCLDRWMRNVADFYRVQDILDAHHVALEFSQEQDYNTSTTQGRLMLNLKLSIAQHESDQTSDRIKYVFAGMRRDRRIITGRVPYGYRVRGKQIVMEPAEAEVVRFAFAEVLRGCSAYRLMDILYDKFGVQIKYGTLLFMLRNRTYTGNTQGVEALAPAVVSEEDFDRVQEVLARHPRRKMPSHTYLYSGLLICPECGRRLCGKWNHYGSDSPYYVCQNHYGATKKGNLVCGFKSYVRESRITSFLMERIAALVAGEVHREKTKKRPKAKRLETLSKVSRSLERLNEIYLMGHIEKAAYLARYDALKNEERSLMEESASNVIQLPAIVRGDDFPALYDSWDREEKRAFWQGLIQRIEFAAPVIPSAPLSLRAYFFGSSCPLT